MRAAARSRSALPGHIESARCRFCRAWEMSPCFSHIWAAKMKNSGDGGPVGTLSEIASICCLAGCIMGCVASFDLPMWGAFDPMYLIGCFHGDASSLANGATGCTPCHVGGACAIIGVAAGVVESDFDQGQKLDLAAGCAAGAARYDDMAIDAGSARTVVA